MITPIAFNSQVRFGNLLLIITQFSRLHRLGDAQSLEFFIHHRTRSITLHIRTAKWHQAPNLTFFLPCKNIFAPRG
jgi:hypothetical protein